MLTESGIFLVSYNGRSSFKLEVSACFGRIYAKIGKMQTLGPV